MLIKAFIICGNRSSKFLGKEYVGRFLKFRLDELDHKG